MGGGVMNPLSDVHHCCISNLDPGGQRPIRWASQAQCSRECGSGKGSDPATSQDCPPVGKNLVTHQGVEGPVGRRLDLDPQLSGQVLLKPNQVQQR